MKISIITPSFNQGQYIERTIQSVLSQKGDFELEYIIVDGCSMDGTKNVVEKYKDQLTWISEKDKGQSDALNKGFTMASGDLLAWLNSDDTYEPHALTEVAEIYRRVRFKWCFGNCRIIDENDREIRKLITKYKVLKSKTYSYKNLLARDFIPQPSVFFTKEIYREIGPICIDCQYSMDYDYWLRIGKKYNPYYIDRYLADFRWHRCSKNGEYYKKASYEAYYTAKKHSSEKDWFSIVQHYFHYNILSLIYRFYDIL